MADKTGIEWTDATWNPVTGCVKVSPGCDKCYAERDLSRWKRSGPNGNAKFDRGGGAIQLHPDRLDQPSRWKRPRRIFVCSVSDLFAHEVPDDFIDAVFAVMWANDRHTFQVLTKRAARVSGWWEGYKRRNGHQSFANQFGWPANIWLGTSVESQDYVGRIDQILRVPAPVHWVSAEPLLGPVDLSLWLDNGHESGGVQGWIPEPLLDWVVAGGESGPWARPMHPDWPRKLRDDCVAAGVPFLFKQWGEYISPGQYMKTNMIDGRWPIWCVNPAGEFAKRDRHWKDHDGCAHYLRRGKKAAGRALDGLEWDQYLKEVAYLANNPG